VPTVTADPASGLAKDNPLGKDPGPHGQGRSGVLRFAGHLRISRQPASRPKLFPARGKARWTALRRQALADGILDASLLRRYESMRPANERSATWDEKQKNVVARALDALEKETKDLGKPNAMSTTIGHIAIGCALGYLDFRFAAENWRTGRPNLTRWYEAFAKAPLDGGDRAEGSDLSGEAAALIARLGLRPHPEGGHFVETYRHAPTPAGRGDATAIYYLLRSGESRAGTG